MPQPRRRSAPPRLLADLQTREAGVGPHSRSLSTGAATLQRPLAAGIDEARTAAPTGANVVRVAGSITTMQGKVTLQQHCAYKPPSGGYSHENDRRSGRPAGTPDRGTAPHSTGTRAPTKAKSERTEPEALHTTRLWRMTQMREMREVTADETAEGSIDSYPRSSTLP